MRDRVNTSTNNCFNGANSATANYFFNNSIALGKSPTAICSPGTYGFFLTAYEMGSYP